MRINGSPASKAARIVRFSPSLMDGVMNGLGYGLVLVVVAFFRELLGSGTLWNHQVVPDSWYAAGYLNNGLMILPPMALILIGVIIWAKNGVKNVEL